MADQGFKRKLTAILSADVAGYSRLMADDETETVKTIASYREIMASLVKQHRGRVVDSPGDNILAEFSSVVDAVQCAVAVQNEIQTRNAELAENRRMEFRIGINLGDVIDEEDCIYGDGVNIAARLEALADPAGICVSKTAFDQIETKLPLGYEYLGEQSVKNIPKPVGAYRVLMKPDAAGKVIGEKRFLGRFSRKTAMAAIITLVIVAGGLIGWNIYLQQSKKVKPASIEKMAFPLPEKPSVAVLPFDNIGGDPEQEYFSDGITENIITQLAQIPNLFVISRQSTFTYKGKNVKVKQVAEEMGVRYILEGSVQSSGNRVRVTAQLIDAITGRHMWADRYERELKDIFTIQDEIAHKVVTEIGVRLDEGEFTRMGRQATQNIEAYKLHMKSLAELRKFTREGLLKARELSEKAIEIDPQYSLAYNLIGWTHALEVRTGYSKNPAQSFDEVDKNINKALELDPDNWYVPDLLTFVYLLKGQYDKSIAQGRRAVERAPNNSDAHAFLAYSLSFSGQAAEAITEITTAMRLAPSYPTWFLECLGQSYFVVCRYEEAIVVFNKYLEREPPGTDSAGWIGSYFWLAVINSAMGQDKQARIAAKKLLNNLPTYSLKQKRSRLLFQDEALKDRIIHYARKAGLPE